METKTVEQELQSIHQKLDFLTEQMQQNQVRQREMQELKEDLTLIGKDMFDAAVEELEDVAPYFETEDLIHLVKKMLRNTRNLNRMLSQMESLEDLYRDLQPLGKQIFDEVMETMHKLDEKGYFEFFGEAAKIVDTVVTSFSVEDVKLLRENITTILMTVKSMTQPEMLSSVNNALEFFGKMDIEVQKDISLFSIVRRMQDPEVKRGMSFMLEFVKNMAKTKEQ